MKPRCEKCVYADITTEIDRYGNIHTFIYCRKRYRYIKHTVNYADDFYDWVKRQDQILITEKLQAVLPEDKYINEIQKTEVLYEMKVKKCKYYKLKSANLMKFINQQKPKTL